MEDLVPDMKRLLRELRMLRQDMMTSRRASPIPKSWEVSERTKPDDDVNEQKDSGVDEKDQTSRRTRVNSSTPLPPILPPAPAYDEPAAPSEIDLDSSLDDVPSLADHEEIDSDSIFSDLSDSNDSMSTISETDEDNL